MEQVLRKNSINQEPNKPILDGSYDGKPLVTWAVTMNFSTPRTASGISRRERLAYTPPMQESGPFVPYVCNMSFIYFPYTLDPDFAGKSARAEAVKHHAAYPQRKLPSLGTGDTDATRFGAPWLPVWLSLKGTIIMDFANRLRALLEKECT